MRANNATEMIAVNQIKGEITGTPKQFQCYPNGDRYLQAQSLTTVPRASFTAYHTAVRVAGDTMLDLVRTLNDDVNLWQFPVTDPDYFDINKDPTGGSMFFYSPDNVEWGSSVISNSIAGTLASPNPAFPTAGDILGGFQNVVCQVIAGNFCVDGKATYLQVVRVNSIPHNCLPDYGNAPQFVFLRWRNQGDPAVIQLP
jgi:hypothetical protein